MARLHLHAEGIAKCAFNTPNPTPAEVRFIYRLASEIPESERPFRIFKIGRTIAAWESDIAAAALRPVSSTTEDETSSAASSG